MKLIEKRLLRGPNIYSRQSCIKVIIDLEDLDNVSSADVPGFTDRLCTLLPSLDAHRCSLGVRGGFIQRLREGTYMAHIIEHVTLELQCLAGSNAGFGRARAVRGQPRCYTIVCAYKIEALIVPALETAMSIVAAVVRGEDISINSLLEPLRRLVKRHTVGPSTQAILDAARQLNIPFSRLTDEASLYQLGFGARQQRIQATITGRTSQIATRIASNKQLTRQLLEQVGIPVPKGEVVYNVESALRAAARLARPVVIKPADANQGKGVSIRLTEPAAITQAFNQARQFSTSVIVEQFIEGADYRVLIVDGKMVAASHREPPYVIGDGKSTIAMLISALNEDPKRGEGHSKALTRITVDVHTEVCVQQQGLSLESVPLAGQRVILRENANLSTGGSANDVTAQIHPHIVKTCEWAAKQIGLDVAGVDLICRDISLPLTQQGAIVEVNAAPGLRMHEMPSHGSPRAVGKAIVQSLFKQGDDGRIPVLAITGTNGKTTTSLLIAHVYQSTGYKTGLTTTEGVFIDDICIRKGDCTGYWSAKTVLGSPEVEVAVLETARGGILKRGLGFDYCDVAVVLNVAGDHLGLDGINTVNDMAKVKRVVATAARRAVVLNADDPCCVDMATSLKPHIEIVYFSTDSQNPVIQAHLAQGGRCVLLEARTVIFHNRTVQEPILCVDDLEITLRGRAHHNILNVLAAVAALVAQGNCSTATIAEGIRSFIPSAEKNPLRLNISHINGVTVLHDYAHNLAAYRAILATAHAMKPNRIVGVITAPGDRRDTDLKELAELCAQELDEIVVYEIEERRGRQVGEMLDILYTGALATVGEKKPVHAVNGVQQAVLKGFQQCGPGDLLLVGGATKLNDLQLIAEQIDSSIKTVANISD